MLCPIEGSPNDGGRSDQGVPCESVRIKMLHFLVGVVVVVRAVHFRKLWVSCHCDIIFSRLILLITTLDFWHSSTDQNMASMIPADAVAVGIGAAFGALSRYHAGRIATEWIATDPNRLGKFAGWHTAGINIGGSFLLGGISASPVVTSERHFLDHHLSISKDCRPVQN